MARLEGQTDEGARTEMNALLITAGYGHDAPRKVWISLRFDHFENKLDERSFIETVMNFGCDIHFAVKASSLLIRSGRYDCCVQYGWISRRIDDLMSQLRGCNVLVTWDNDYHPPIKSMI